MKIDLPKQYNPKNVEDKFYKFWEENGFFHAAADKNRKPYTIVIPPPNVTSVLHMGHGLNNTIQDILIRFKRMQGYAAEWMPGTDHAGIATQNIVEKELAKEGKNRKEIGRDAFVEKVWQWKEKCESRILEQLKKIGCSCDWERTRFTMDEGLSRAVRKAFVDLYKKGLIYKGRYIINWCPRCETALSDEEAEHEMHKGNLWYIKYPVKDTKEYITVATTRPETMLGDTAVAVNPNDKRFKKYIGKTLVLPLADREIPVIADDFVDLKFGTGAVKVTPAHDPNDFEIGRRHDLTPVVIMDEKAVMSADAGLEYQGMDRYEAREKIIIDLEEKKLLERIENHEHSVGHCYRCHTVVEPYISEQWFVKMKPLAKPALKAVKTAKVKIYPERWIKVYCNWLEGIRDWCISRQIWWGHRIPVYYCKKCCKESGTQSSNFKAQSSKTEKGIIVSESKVEKCPDCGSTDIEQDKDVLDTWFSSWLWPFSTFGWPEKNPDLDYFYPTNTLSTASEIIFFWVARMIMAGYEFMGKEPFKDIYIHGTVRDEIGRKMSKSLGNGIDPIDVVEKYGADALRFSVIIITAQGQDVFLSGQKFEIGRNFANKIWNASRFLLMFMEDFSEPDKMVLTMDDKYILYRLAQTVGVINKSLEAYRFNDAAQGLYEFIWHEFCDKYIETVKPVLYGEDIADKNRVRSVLLNVLEVSTQLLHPIMPFITEEIWQKIYEISGREKPCKSIMVSKWPDIKVNREDSKIVKMVEGKYELVKSMRNLRSEHNVPPSKDVDYIVKCSDKKLASALEEDMPGFKKLVKGSNIKFDASFKPEGPMPTAIFPFGNIYMTIESAVDISSEKSRLEAQLAKIEEERAVINKKLSNRAFLKKAPKEVVDKQKAKKKQLQETSAKINASLKFLSEKSKK